MCICFIFVLYLCYICVNILNVFVVNSPWVGDQEVLAGDGHWPRSYTSNPPSYALTVHTNTDTNTDTNTHANTVSNLCTIVTVNPIMTSLLENTNSLLHCTVFTHFSWSPYTLTPFIGDNERHNFCIVSQIFTVYQRFYSYTLFLPLFMTLYLLEICSSFTS